MTSWRSLVLVTLLVPACIKGNPARGMAATGNPLMVRLERGTGTTGSRIANGSYEGHLELETALKAYYGRKHAMVFTTG